MVGIWGTKEYARGLREDIRDFLESLKLKLSMEKTLITNARTKRAKFLGTYVTKSWVKGTIMSKGTGSVKKRIPAGNI